MRREMEVVTEHCKHQEVRSREVCYQPLLPLENMSNQLCLNPFDVREMDIKTFDMRCECELSGDDACSVMTRAWYIRSLMQYLDFQARRRTEDLQGTPSSSLRQDSSRRRVASVS